MAGSADHCPQSECSWMKSELSLGNPFWNRGLMFKSASGKKRMGKYAKFEWEVLRPWSQRVSSTFQPLVIRQELVTNNCEIRQFHMENKFNLSRETQLDLIYFCVGWPKENGCLPAKKADSGRNTRKILQEGSFCLKKGLICLISQYRKRHLRKKVEGMFQIKGY